MTAITIPTFAQIFAERVEEDRVDPLLPEHCFAYHPYDGSRIYIRRGVRGYYQVGASVTATMEQLNEALGVTPLAVDCMVAGALFGWEKPEAQLSRFVRMAFRKRG